jgi:hypothetical protein
LSEVDAKLEERHRGVERLDVLGNDFEPESVA